MITSQRMDSRLIFGLCLVSSGYLSCPPWLGMCGMEVAWRRPAPSFRHFRQGGALNRTMTFHISTQPVAYQTHPQALQLVITSLASVFFWTESKAAWPARSATLPRGSLLPSGGWSPVRGLPLLSVVAVRGPGALGRACALGSARRAVGLGGVQLG